VPSTCNIDLDVYLGGPAGHGRYRVHIDEFVDIFVICTSPIFQTREAIVKYERTCTSLINSQVQMGVVDITINFELGSQRCEYSVEYVDFDIERYKALREMFTPKAVGTLTKVADRPTLQK
jgi:hypothetical protein